MLNLVFFLSSFQKHLRTKEAKTSGLFLMKKSQKECFAVVKVFRNRKIFNGWNGGSISTVIERNIVCVVDVTKTAMALREELDETARPMGSIVHDTYVAD